MSVPLAQNHSSPGRQNLLPVPIRRVRLMEESTKEFQALLEPSVKRPRLLMNNHKVDLTGMIEKLMNEPNKLRINEETLKQKLAYEVKMNQELNQKWKEKCSEFNRLSKKYNQLISENSRKDSEQKENVQSDGDTRKTTIIEELNKTVDELRQENTKNENQIREFDSKLKELQSAQENADRYKTQLDKKSEEFDVTEAKRIELNAQCEQLQSNNTTLQENVNNLNKRLTKNNNKIKNLEEEIEKLKNSRAPKIEQTPQDEADLTNLKKELAEKTDQIDKLSKENAELKSQSNAKPIITTEGLKNAFEKLVEQSNKNAKDNEALNEQLKKIEAENKENGYQADFWKKKYESLSEKQSKLSKFAENRPDFKENEVNDLMSDIEKILGKFKASHGSFNSTVNSAISTSNTPQPAEITSPSSSTSNLNVLPPIEITPSTPLLGSLLLSPTRTIQNQAPNGFVSPNSTVSRPVERTPSTQNQVPNGFVSSILTSNSTVSRPVERTPSTQNQVPNGFVSFIPTPVVNSPILITQQNSFASTTPLINSPISTTSQNATFSFVSMGNSTILSSARTVPYEKVVINRPSYVQQVYRGQMPNVSSNPPYIARQTVTPLPGVQMNRQQLYQQQQQRLIMPNLRPNGHQGYAFQPPNFQTNPPR